MQMDIPRISVLVPVYKVEAYLQRCIDSVLAQDFQDWEMILVDDGSPDRCPQICDEAARKDPRISVIHKENGGLPSARLAGFERAKGEYLVFLDSDDWLLEGALTTLYHEITSDGGYDIVKSRPLRVNNEGRETKEDYPINEGVINDRESYGASLILGKIMPYLHSGIYRKKVFSAEIFNVVQNAKISFCEDWFANVLAIQHVNKVKIINQSTYAYFVNHESIVGTCVVSPGVNVLIENVLEAACSTVSNTISNSLRTKMLVNDIRSFFIPEIPFSLRRYRTVRKNLCLINGIVGVSLDPKFIRFINNMPLFYCYSILYRFLFFVIKLKGHTRKILYSNGNE